MKGLWPGDRFASIYEKLVLSFVQVLLMVLILLAVLDLGYLLWRGVTRSLWWAGSLQDMQRGLQNGFAGALLVMIGLELLETTRAYLHDRHIRLEVIVVVAVVAVARHIILLDVAHLDGLTLIGIAALIAALVAAYFVVRKVNPSTSRANEPVVTAGAEELARE